MTRARRRSWWLLAAFLSQLAAAVPAAEPPAFPIVEPGSAPLRSPNHLCVSQDGSVAYVAEHTSDSVAVVDLERGRVTARIETGSRPAHLLLSPDGGTLYVSCLYSYRIDVVDLGAGRVVRSIGTGFEPYGMALDPAGTTLFVANAISETVSWIDVASGRTVRAVPVGQAPRYLALDPSGRKLLVGSSLSRRLEILDASSGRLLETRDLGRASILRQIVCSPDGRWAFVAHLVSHDEVPPQQLERGWIHSNGFSVLDLERPGHRVTLLLDHLLRGASAPWGMAISADGRKLYVSLAGVHEVAIVDVERALELVAETGPERVVAVEQDVEIVRKRGIAQRFPAGGEGPRGIALAEARGLLVAACYFSDTLTLLDAASGAPRGIVPLGPRPEPSVWRRGEMLFNDARITHQSWFSCYGCHQEDATVDGLVWDLSNDGLGNPKNAKSLHDAHDTPPAMWGAVRKDMGVAVAAGQRFQGFLPDPENNRALLEFLSKPPVAPNPFRDRDPDSRVRGERVFQKARCDVCHPAPLFTDLRKHDLELAAPTDLYSRFDTPSLRECYRTAPYLHDGRARTLRDVLTVHNPRDIHGRVAGLTPRELEDLLEYLRGL